MSRWPNDAPVRIRDPASGLTPIEGGAHEG